MKSRRYVFGFAALLAVGAAGDGPYETPPELKASDFLDAKLLQGPDYVVEPTVTSDGVFNTYTITSNFGTWKVQSTSLAAVRVHEVAAIAQLKNVDKIAVAAGGVAQGAIDVGKGVGNVVIHPVNTVSNLGDGIARLFGRVGRGAGRAGEKMGGDDSSAAIEENLSNPKDAEKASQQGTAGKAVDATGALAADLIGVNSAMRMWARKLTVDPYTRNEVLHNELRDVAQYDAGGRLTVHLVPGGAILTALSTTATVNDLVWMEEPDKLVTLNEKRLKEMGVKPEVSKAFRLNPRYNLTRQVRLIASIDTLKDTKGRADFIARAAGAKADADAQFYVESAMLTDLFNKTEAPVSAIVSGLPGACVIAKGDRFACLYPLDYIAYTENVAAAIDRMTKKAQSDYPKAKRELWLSGRPSPRASQELQTRGWTVHEKSLKLISEEAQPENTPQKRPEVPPATGTPAAAK
ncbi:MAG TPA: hypothetical protein VGQ32_08840 [Thermoanaerobaculia bacterium]|jgi:hypothetical protein|nr:hypothetical protein [Thermoanaerobaculia bacterium]